ncbi:hypothetical protein H6F98_11480 [Microcoleus sp. FACHB-SPT15]|uniref:hypothetical protein n=1 Tax=Microcoleus sp. FACHB-SPT15 TaxID=2692830 RepID=UPI0017841EB3|nr:hypothetical protein [Microcoleus sp. FACHB-SPT15]MBD1806068.1 hypothetical protein [Microcoleus sp. FACHB-SPT15]
MERENEDSKKILVKYFGFDIESKLRNIKLPKDKLELLKKKYLEIREKISKKHKPSYEDQRIGIFYLGKILNEIMLELTHDSGKSTNYGRWLDENLDTVDPSHRSEQNYRNLYKYIHEKFDGAGFFCKDKSQASPYFISLQQINIENMKKSYMRKLSMMKKILQKI